MRSRLAALGIGPVALVATCADVVAAAPAPLTEVVDLTPTGSVDSALCQPLYGRDKGIGIPVRIEDADGDAVTDLTGYSFQLRAADGTVQEIPVGNGSGESDPANVSTDTANSLVESLGSIPPVLLAPGVVYLNCSPGTENEPFADGTELVAIVDGVDVAAGSVAGRFAPNLGSLDEEALQLVIDRLEVLIDATLVGCNVGELSALWETFIEPTGLATSTEITNLVASQAWTGVPHDCAGATAESFVLFFVLQAMFRDGPLGLLPATSDTIVVPSGNSLDWADAGLREAVILESLSDDDLPNTGTPWTLWSGFAALFTVAGASLRRVARS